jgi:RNA polymerase sigma factor (sigma-70 family)
MNHSTLAAGLRHLRGIVASRHYREDSDEQLLHVFATQRDESAFAALVRRHGPMVLHVCRRTLGHEQDAEDAFQATFLVLARNAARLRKKSSLAGFLHGTAYRLAMSAKRAAARRRKHEAAFGARTQPRAPADDLSLREVRTLLDEEIARLPDKFRNAFILCCLEDLSRTEAAQRLGVNEGTLSSRLAEARRRLQRRLTRRGVELTAVLAASTLAGQSASALAPVLVSSTLKAAMATALGQGTADLVSGHVAGLANGTASTALRGKIVMLLALTAGAVAVGAASRAALRREPPAPSTETPRAEAAKSPAEKPAETVTVRGRVLGPDGKPVKDARLYWPRLRTPQPRSEEDIEYPERARTDAEGRFRFELPATEAKLRTRRNVSLIAVADGYGADWTALPAAASPAEVTLRLVKDLPISGRIVNTEGKPLAGVRVGIVSLATTPDGKLDAFLTAWKNQWQSARQQTPKMLFVPANKVLPSATTDKDGHFRLGGIGAGRVAEVQVRGTAISQGSLWIVGQDGFDPTEINKSVAGQIRRPAEELLGQRPPLLYGPKLTYVAQPSRRIEGRVREAGSGKPVAGYVILCGAGYNNSRSAVTDKEGRYRIDGVPKMKQYLLGAWPPADSAWLRAGARVEDREGLQPITVDFTVARGILLRGRVIDRASGKGVKGGIRFVPLPGNKFADKPGHDSYKYDSLINDVDAEGRFGFPVIPGPGVLMVQVERNIEKANGDQPLNPYKLAEFDAKDREHVHVTVKGDDRYFTRLGGALEFLNLENAVKYIDLAPDAGMATCDLFVERGQTLSVKIEDADGKPLKGATVAGVTASWPNTFPIQDATCTIFALDPKKPRRLLFYHAERKLAGSLMVRGDEKEPPVARLSPTGSAIGRLLDRDGQPIAGAEVRLNSPDRTAGELYRQLQQRQKAIRTDKEGRFRVDGIVPDVQFTLGITQGRTFLIGEPPIGVKQVKAGEMLDLGDVRVKPGP